MKIRLENLTKIFKDKQGRETIAVDKLNVEIEDGKLVGLLGPSGCGKSTTLYMIAGLHTPTSGSIFFDDEDVTKVSPENRGIGLVFQNYALYPHMTILENILFPLQNMGMKKDEALEEANKIAELVGISSQLNKKPSQLSGGQQQRVAIARALVKKPRVLLLDEPLSNLDARLRLQMREEIKRIQKETGITTVFVTHDQEEAMSICDSIVLMEYGVEQQRGLPQAIYDDPHNLFVAKFLGTPPINLYNATVENGYVKVGNEKVTQAPNVSSKVKTWDEMKSAHPVVLENNEEVTVKVAGSKKLKPFIEKLISDFSAIAGNFKYELNMNGSEEAFNFVQGPKRDKKVGADIGISSRSLREDERGVARFIKPFLLDSPVVLLHKDNPLNDLSHDELKKILKGKIKFWDHLPKGENQIELLMTDALSGVRNLLLDKLGLYISDSFKVKKYKPLESELEVMKQLSVNPKGFAIVSFSEYKSLLKDKKESKPSNYKDKVLSKIYADDQDYKGVDLSAQSEQVLDSVQEFDLSNIKVVTINNQEVTEEAIKDFKVDFACRGVIICRSNPKKQSELLAVAFADYLKSEEATAYLRKQPNTCVQPKEYILGVRPEGYEIVEHRGDLTINFDYYESIGRDVSIVCRHKKALNKTFRAILNEKKQISYLNEKENKFQVKLIKDKFYLFEKETGERVL